MNIGIIGAGAIGRTLVLRLSAAGHDVKVANSRGPDTIDRSLLENGARAVTAQEALTDVDVAILSIPPTGYGKIRSLVNALPDDAVVVDTANYYPHRDVRIEAIEAGQIEAQWIAEQLGRPIVKAWKAISAESLASKSSAKGSDGRIAIPVAGDREHDRAVAIALVSDTGFDGYDAGTLADAWRQQPGAPVYCTDLTYNEMGPALAAAERHRLPKRRDIVISAVTERMDDGTSDLTPGHLGTVDHDYLVRLNRAIYL